MSPWVAVQPEDKSWRGEGQLVWGPGPAVSHPGCGSQSTTQPDARPCLSFLISGTEMMRLPTAQRGCKPNVRRRRESAHHRASG